MAVLLEIDQGERRHLIGVFASCATALNFLESLPFVVPQRDEWGTRYLLPYRLLPYAHVAHYKGHRYVFSRLSYLPERMEGEIEAVIRPLSLMDRPSRDGAYVKGQTLLDAYVFPNDSCHKELVRRHLVLQEARHHYAKQGLRVTISGRGTEDGEYVQVNDRAGKAPGRIAFLLDPQTLLLRKKSHSFAEFLKAVEAD